MVIFCHYKEQMKWRGGEGCTSLACVASVCVWFRSKERLHEERDSRFWSREKWNKSQKMKVGERFYLRHFSRNLWLSFPVLLNRTETFATQASTSSTYNNVTCIRVRHRFYIWVRCLLCWVQSSLLWEIPFRMLQFFLLLINYNIRSWTQEHFQTPFLNSQVMLSPLYSYSRMACTRICRS